MNKNTKSFKSSSSTAHLIGPSSSINNPKRPGVKKGVAVGKQLTSGSGSNSMRILTSSSSVANLSKALSPIYQGTSSTKGMQWHINLQGNATSKKRNFESFTPSTAMAAAAAAGVSIGAGTTKNKKSNAGSLHHSQKFGSLIPGTIPHSISSNMDSISNDNMSLAAKALESKNPKFL